MKVIYPEETLTLLAKYDAFLNDMAEYYQRHYPQEPRRMLEDPYYQACIQEKTKIIMMSPCKYLLDTKEAAQWKEQQ